MAITGVLGWSVFPLIALILAIWHLGANYLQLRHISGPLVARFSRAYIFWKELNAQLPLAQRAAIKKYGSPARLGPTLLVTDDPDLVRRMSAPGSKWTRSHWYSGNKIDVRTDSVFSTRDEKLHADMKAKEAGGYAGRDIDLESDIDARLLDLLQLIKSKYHKSPMDMAAISRYFTLDVLSTIAFGAPFGFMANNCDLWDYIKTTSSFLLVISLVTNHKSVQWVFQQPWLQALAGPSVTDKSGVGPMLAFARKAVAERFADENKVVKKDMLGHFVNKGLSQTQCEVEAAIQIIAGSDSTSSVLRTTVYMLIASPIAYNKLRAEIDANEGNMSYPIIRFSEAEKLPYLVAVIWEGIRLYPPLFGMKSKCAPPGGDSFKGIHYPEGCEVAICDEALSRNKDVFGPDADLFRPDRWMEADEETRKKYLRVVETIFGTGRFLCLGKHIAMVELHKTFVELFRKFDWAIADPLRGVDDITRGIHDQSNMNLVAYPRV